MTRVRDLFVQRVCNFLLTRVATKEYEALVGVAVKRGLEQIERGLPGFTRCPVCGDGAEGQYDPALGRFVGVACDCGWEKEIR